jgi:hypothetical protein
MTTMPSSPEDHFQALLLRWNIAPEDVAPSIDTSKIGPVVELDALVKTRPFLPEHARILEEAFAGNPGPRFPSGGGGVVVADSIVVAPNTRLVLGTPEAPMTIVVFRTMTIQAGGTVTFATPTSLQGESLVVEESRTPHFEVSSPKSPTPAAPPAEPWREWNAPTGAEGWTGWSGRNGDGGQKGVAPPVVDVRVDVASGPCVFVVAGGDGGDGGPGGMGAPGGNGGDGDAHTAPGKGGQGGSGGNGGAGGDAADGPTCRFAVARPQPAFSFSGVSKPPSGGKPGPGGPGSAGGIGGKDPGGLLGKGYDPSRHTRGVGATGTNGRGGGADGRPGSVLFTQGDAI